MIGTSTETISRQRLFVNVGSEVEMTPNSLCEIEAMNGSTKLKQKFL